MKKFFIISLLLVLILSLGVLYSKLKFPVKYINYVTEISEKYNVERISILALIKAESNFRETAISSKGAVGMMQLMPSTAKWIAKKRGIKFDINDLYKYKTNIEIGVIYYKYLYENLNGDFEKILAAYNAGISRIENEQWKKISETRKYVWKVKIYRFFYSLLFR
ncbi:lytic transglycosylase domain-containing protein [Haliovirga abyssi]|uniref:Lytic transglycosylase n=1 Tax=Haliovirga abyssi TaxID=2996794 RepID=A0AAU9D3R1_9FUSO|nr:lytic transglycosylase domain-containing protein [Haliovirga abyssi]BDU50599.1 lytic transglycosylase [Haliovirga abyssi]